MILDLWAEDWKTSFAPYTQKPQSGNVCGALGKAHHNEASLLVAVCCSAPAATATVFASLVPKLESRFCAACTTPFSPDTMAFTRPHAEFRKDTGGQACVETSTTSFFHASRASATVR